MISDAKDSSELMVDLAYAAVYFGDPQMGEEVVALGERLDLLVHDMRAVCVLAVRTPREADAMASVLKVVSSIERIAHAAMDIARIVTHRLGIPRALVVDLSDAEEVAHRVLVREGSHFAHRTIEDFELPVAVGMRIVAVHRGRDWITDVTTDLDRAIDVLVEMKNISETCVGLAWSALVLRDPGLAAEVNHLEDRLDEMQDRLETWVLRSSAEALDPSPLRGLLHLAAAAEDLGDAAQGMTWLISEREEVHPILSLALGDSDEVVVRYPVAAGSRVDGRALSELQLDIDPGFHVLAVRRGGRYAYRPRGSLVLRAGDELIASGPDEGQGLLADLCGWVLIEDDETGEDVLQSRDGAEAVRA
jgi:uncharacterized protein with PhoU and TrkA domain